MNKRGSFSFDGIIAMVLASLFVTGLISWTFIEVRMHQHAIYSFRAHAEITEYLQEKREVASWAELDQQSTELENTFVEYEYKTTEYGEQLWLIFTWEGQERKYVLEREEGL